MVSNICLNICLNIWLKLTRKIWIWRGVLIVVPNATLIIVLARILGLLQPAELKALDQFFILRPQQAVDSRIVIVEIRDKDLKKQKQWPLSDIVVTDLLKKINQHKPRAIGLDIYRNFPVAPEYYTLQKILAAQPKKDDLPKILGHQDLVELLKTTPNIIGVQKVFESKDSSPIDPHPILKEKSQVGGNDFPLDGDGKIRRMPLYLYLQDKKQDNQYLESFALKLALLYLAPEGITEKPAKNNPNYLQLGNAVFPRFMGNDGSYVRASDGSYQIILNYRGEINKFTTVSLTSVLENNIPPHLMQGKVVLIGSTAESLKDLFYTPYTSRVFAEPSRTPGVVIHANLVSEILSAVLDGRPLIQFLSEPLEILWIFTWTLLGSFLSWQNRYSSIFNLLSILLAALLLFIICFIAFIFSYWIPLVPAILGLLSSAIATTQYVAINAAKMQKTFGRYLTDEVVENILETPGGLTLGGEKRKVTILVSDVRGFSAISEQFSPEIVVQLLNLYLEEMTEVINSYQGTINDFMGDGILVMFGAPISREDDSQRAIACAIAMQLAMEKVNNKNRAMNLPILEMGIGINTGEVVAGNIGSQKRAEYTVIGGHVNLAARIESYTVGGQVFISENTYQDTNITLRVDSELEVEPKGIKHPIKLYEVSGIGGKYKLFLATEEESMIKINDDVPIEFMILQGKHVNSNLLPGTLVGLSQNGAQLRTKYALERLTNIKLKLLTETALFYEEPDIYAKVIKKSELEENHYIIRFTSLPPRAISRLSRIRDPFIS